MSGKTLASPLPCDMPGGDLSPIGRAALHHALLIRNAGMLNGSTIDVAVAGDRVTAIGRELPGSADRTIDARGGLLLPGLNDHHIHLAATAAALASVACGPPGVMDADALVAALCAGDGTGWLRGIGYHESVAGSLNRDWIDAAVPSRPVRIQHRSGRMWYLNSLAIDRLLETDAAPPAGMERDDGRWTGRLFDADGWLRAVLAGTPPPLDAIGAALAACGVTGVTDMSPDNDLSSADYLAGERRRGALPQHVMIAGMPSLGDTETPGVTLGPLKLHLHEAELPDFDATVAQVLAAHARGRAVAVHCVTEVELVFALVALRDAGPMPGDRIEHASVASDALVGDIAEMGLRVVAQPHFVAERGDLYRAEIPPGDWPSLYRLHAFRAAGVVLAGGSDAPYGQPDPWAAMAAAVSRRTAGGALLGPDEALTPEEALDLFLADQSDLTHVRRVAPGGAADLVLLDRPWTQLRGALGDAHVSATVIAGRVVHDAVDEPPVERRQGTDALA